MTVLILNWRDIKHPLRGGAEISLFEHAKYWQKHGVTVVWFAASFPEAKSEEIIEGIRIIRRGSHFTVHVHAYFCFIRYLKKTVDIIVDNFHFIPFFTPLYAKDKTILAFINEPAKEAWFKNINMVVAFIGYVLEPCFFFPYRRNLFLTGSASIAKELCTYGIASKQVKIVPHGITVDPAVKAKRESLPIILYLAQLAPDKGIEDAIKMFSLVRKEIPVAILWVVGRPINEVYQKKLLKLVEILHIPRKAVRFFGFISEKEKYQLLQKAWVLVHPSLREGWGLTILEAASYGTPSVGYRVTGLSDSIQHMQTGLLTEKNTPYDLSQLILWLLRNKKIYDTLSQNARVFAKNFSWEKSGKLSFRILKNLYEKRKNA